MSALLTSCETDPSPRAEPRSRLPAPEPDVAPVPAQDVSEGDLRAEPACKPFIDIEGRIVVGGRPTDLKVERAEELPKIRTYGWAPGQVLVALKTDWITTPAAHPEGRLSRVDCRTGARVPVYFEAAADLGNTVVAQNGRHLYFSGARGLSMLDTWTSRTTLLARAPKAPTNCAAAPPESEGRLRDLPRSLSRAGDRLVFHRGGACGADHAWTAQELELRGPTDGVLGTRDGTTEVHRPHPVATLAKTGKDVLWLGDAGRCNEPGIRDPASDGIVWRSRDHGASWEKVPVSDPKHGAMVTAADTIWTDLNRPGHLVVHSTICKTSAATRGGSVFRTRDGGKTWARLSVPRIIDPADAGQYILGVRPKAGDLDRLFMWTRHGLFRTRNFGETWFPVADDAKDHPGASPSEARRYEQIGGFIFRATPDGLVRREQATRRVDRVFPAATAP